MRIYKKTIKFTFVIEHDGDKEFEKELDYICELAENHAYQGVDDAIAFAITSQFQKNGHGLSFRGILDKIVRWHVKTKNR